MSVVKIIHSAASTTGANSGEVISTRGTQVFPLLMAMVVKTFVLPDVIGDSNGIPADNESFSD